MVAAKLDQIRVLVTKFRQNRFMLTGRSAGQRHRDRQTNVGKNKGPSGLLSGQHTDKPVGFYGPIAPPVSNAPVPNAPSSERPRASIAARHSAAG